MSLFYAVVGVSSVLAFFLRPIPALCTFCIALFSFPRPVTIEVASLNFSSGRIVIIPLLANIIFRTRLWRQFKWNGLDTWVIIYSACRLIALGQNVPRDLFLVRESGDFLMDLLLPYFAVRLIIRSKADVISLFKCLLLFAIPLSLLGIFESLKGWSPVDWIAGGYRREMRLGLSRAGGTFSVHIAFGLFFAGLTTICAGLWKQKVWSPVTILVVLGFQFLGIFSSMSSAPFFSIFVSITMLCCFPFRRFWPILTVCFLSACVFLEFYSNRHFYEVFTRFALSGKTAAYRVNLINEALGGGMRGHWIFGYGYVGIAQSNYNNSTWHWQFRDLVNIYIAILARTGLVGLLPFLCMNFLYYKRLYEAARFARGRIADSWFIWCLAAALVGWNVAMMTVPPIEQIQTLLYILMAVCCNLPSIMRAQAVKPALARARNLSTSRPPGRSARRFLPEPHGDSGPGSRYPVPREKRTAADVAGGTHG